MSAMKVFISSTVYDLLDIRAEVESHLASMGITPILSGSSTSTFEIMPDRNSIDTCLVNLESCDAVVVILCQRYGPSLAKAGFADLSATHLEYQRAREKNIPLYVYVRDRLEADYRYWRNLPEADRSEAKYAWAKSKGDNLRLFGLLHEHQELNSTSPATNWFSPFRDSMELKKLLTRNLGQAAAVAQLETLIQSDRMPVLQPLCKLESRVENLGGGQLEVVAMIRVRLRNESATAAFNVRIELALNWMEELVQESWPSIAPRGHTIFSVHLHFHHKHVDAHGSLLIQYTNVLGHQVQDRYDLRSDAIHHAEARTVSVETNIAQRQYSPSAAEKPYAIVSKFFKNL